ncbi:MAG: DUF6786 family protein [Flavisolibacter sp.]
MYKPELLLVILILTSCNNKSPDKVKELHSYKEGSFGYDLLFLQKHDSVIVLKNDSGDDRVVVSAKYQGKVFTSTAEGDTGKSFGWINYKAFDADIDPHMNAYGGENRFWLGPEGGPFSLFFPKGAEMKFENWKTPAAFDTEPWSVASKDNNAVHLQKEMRLMNYAGTELQLSVDRTITILDRESIEKLVDLSLHDKLKSVGYKTVNSITNTGSKEWNEKSGMPCVWILDMFKPSDATTILVPYNSLRSNAKIATTNYFGEISSDRIKYNNGILFFKADGKKRGKLGLHENRAKNIAGSYDSKSNVLTISFFDVTEGKYLDQQWTRSKSPFTGDVVNAYNDGPLEDGKQMGPFYEIESVSPAAFLKPGSTLTHNHSVLHFTGDKKSLDVIVKKLFGIPLEDIENAF